MMLVDAPFPITGDKPVPGNSVALDGLPLSNVPNLAPVSRVFRQPRPREARGER